MNKLELPTTWSLDTKTDEELLFIAQRRLQRAVNRARLLTRLADWWFVSKQKKRELNSRYYADWYALAAINELINREIPGGSWSE